jgi:transcriptional regulator with XRE-family HTH domain
MARTTDDDAPHPLDIAMGSRVRQRRKELGLSQSKLANALGITFQQVQKYEHGTNRISFSRLVEISTALECSVADLIGDLDKTKNSAVFSRQVARLTESGASDLLEAYANIKSPKRRRALLDLARQLVAELGTDAHHPVPRGRAGTAAAKRAR